MLHLRLIFAYTPTAWRKGPRLTLKEYCTVKLPSSQARSGAVRAHPDRANFEGYAKSQGYGRGGLYATAELDVIFNR